MIRHVMKIPGPRMYGSLPPSNSHPEAVPSPGFSQRLLACSGHACPASGMCVFLQGLPLPWNLPGLLCPYCFTLYLLFKSRSLLSLSPDSNSLHLIFSIYTLYLPALYDFVFIYLVPCPSWALPPTGLWSC